jgi:glutamine---fructose-6-phosphate transaminase (isomerizing)
MCGIVGYLGPSAAAPILLSELKCLEYRGYDSAGVAVMGNGRLCIVKAAGKLSNLERLLKDKAPQATVGIGHTRWASHGEPNDENAHPHTDCTGTIAVVHNGIIENFEPLRNELIVRGHKFSSDTDTEILAHLIEEEFKAHADMVKALRAVIAKIEGAYAIGVINQHVPGKLYAVNGHYSLAVGLKDDASYLASDSVAVRQYTNKVLRIGQGEIAEIKANGACLFSFNGDRVERNPLFLDTDPFVLSKDGYKHFLLKEIYEQPLVMRQTLSKYLDHINLKIDFNIAAGSSDSAYGIKMTREEIRQIRRIQILACGTAFHSAMIGKYIIEDLSGIPTEPQIASETRGRHILADRDTLTIAVSQSGETADTLAAVTSARASKSIMLGITNRPDSHLAQICPNLIVTECGVEISVAATKTFVAQLAAFYLLGIWLAEQKDMISAEKSEALKKALLLMPTLQEKILAGADKIREKSIAYADAHDFVFVGRGYNYPVALEGALKLKELSYIHASGYAAGELKHGPIAVLDSSVPVVSILVPGTIYEKAFSNAQETKARNAKMIAVAVESDNSAARLFDTVFPIPNVDEFFSPLLTVLPLQLMSYFVSDYLGKDVDQPRNLAKSVTIE